MSPPDPVPPTPVPAAPVPGVAGPGVAGQRSGASGRSLAGQSQRGWLGGQDGASTVETVLLLPLVLLLTLLPVQAGLVWHAHQVLVAAAQEGARASRQADLSAAQAQAAGSASALAFTAQAGGRAVSDASVRVERGPQQVQVQVQGRALAVLPGFGLLVRARAVSPVERFVPS